MKIQTVYNIFDPPYRFRKNGIYNVPQEDGERFILEGRAFDPFGEITQESLAKPKPKKATTKKSTAYKKKA